MGKGKGAIRTSGGNANTNCSHKPPRSAGSDINKSTTITRRDIPKRIGGKS